MATCWSTMELRCGGGIEEKETLLGVIVVVVVAVDADVVIVIVLLFLLLNFAFPLLLRLFLSLLSSGEC